jgi:large subunit ribosomal protein L21
MYAIVETGGKQYRAEVGATLEIERLDAEPGESIDLDRVLLLRDESGTRIGRPYLDGVKVTAEVDGEVKGRKITVFKLKRRKGYRRKLGHRQRYTRIRVTGIEA